MDLPEDMRRVSVEPKMVNIYEDYWQALWPYLLNPGTAYIFQFSIPDDGYTYQLAEFDWAVWGWYDYGGHAGPVFVNGGFSFSQSPASWNWITGGWCEGYKRHVPTKFGGLAQRYPGAYGAYIWNNSGGYMTVFIAINMYRKYIED